MPLLPPLTPVTVMLSVGSEVTPPKTGPTRSLLVTAIVVVFVAVIVGKSDLATGGSFTSTMVSVIVTAADVASRSSLAVTLKVSVPVAVGVRVIGPGAGCRIERRDRALASGPRCSRRCSEPPPRSTSVHDDGAGLVRLLVAAGGVRACTPGASLTGLRVMSTVAEFDWSAPSRGGDREAVGAVVVRVRGVGPVAGRRVDRRAAVGRLTDDEVGQGVEVRVRAGQGAGHAGCPRSRTPGVGSEQTGRHVVDADADEGGHRVEAAVVGDHRERVAAGDVMVGRVREVAGVRVERGHVAAVRSGVPTRSVRVSFSGSVQVTVPSTGTFLSVDSVRPEHTGLSLTGSTVIDMVAVLELTVPSLARNVKLSGPL